MNLALGKYCDLIIADSLLIKDEVSSAFLLRKSLFLFDLVIKRLNVNLEYELDQLVVYTIPTVQIECGVNI